MRQLLQTVVVITKCDIYYRLCQYSQGQKMCGENERWIFNASSFQIFMQVKFQGIYINAISWWFFSILKRNFLNFLILHVKCSVEKKTCFIQFSWKNRALHLGDIFLPTHYKVIHRYTIFIGTRQHNFESIKFPLASFFNCYLAAPRPALGHYWGTASLTWF